MHTRYLLSVLTTSILTLLLTAPLSHARDKSKEVTRKFFDRESSRLRQYSLGQTKIRVDMILPHLLSLDEVDGKILDSKSSRSYKFFRLSYYCFMSIKKSRLKKAQEQDPETKKFRLRGKLVRYIVRRSHDALDERTIYNFEASSITPLEDEGDTFDKYSTDDTPTTKSGKKPVAKTPTSPQPTPAKPKPAPESEQPQDRTAGNKYFLKSKRVLGEIISRYNNRRVEIKFVYRGIKLASGKISEVMEGKEGRDYLLLNGQDNDLDGVSGNTIHIIFPDKIKTVKAKIKDLEIGDTVTLKCLVLRVRELGRKVYFLQVEGLERAPLQDIE